MAAIAELNPSLIINAGKDRMYVQCVLVSVHYIPFNCIDSLYCMHVCTMCSSPNKYNYVCTYNIFSLNTDEVRQRTRL